MLRGDPASSHGGHIMKLLAATGVLLFASASAHAQAPAQTQTQAPAQAAKPCEELKDEITKKLDAKGVKAYTLEIVAKDKDAEGKIVGTCDGGTRRSSTPRPQPPPSPRQRNHPSPDHGLLRPHTHRHLRFLHPDWRLRDRTKQADFFFRFRSYESVGLRREDLLTIATNLVAMNLSVLLGRVHRCPGTVSYLESLTFAFLPNLSGPTAQPAPFAESTLHFRPWNYVRETTY